MHWCYLDSRETVNIVEFESEASESNRSRILNIRLFESEMKNSVTVKSGDA